MGHNRFTTQRRRRLRLDGTAAMAKGIDVHDPLRPARRPRPGRARPVRRARGLRRRRWREQRRWRSRRQPVPRPEPVLGDGGGVAVDAQRDHRHDARVADAQRLAHRVHRDRGPPVGAGYDEPGARSLDLLRRLHGRRRRGGDASRHLLLQRRAGLGHGLAAPGLVRAQAPGHRRAGHHADGAVPLRRQRGQPDRHDRPRVRRRGRHRAVGGDRAAHQPDVLGRRRRRRRAARLRPALARGQRPHDLAAVPLRRVLRHHARAGARAPAGDGRAARQRRRRTVLHRRLQQQLLGGRAASRPSTARASFRATPRSASGTTWRRARPPTCRPTSPPSAAMPTPPTRPTPPPGSRAARCHPPATSRRSSPSPACPRRNGTRSSTWTTTPSATT